MKNYLSTLVLGLFMGFAACEGKMDEDEIATIGMVDCKKPGDFIAKKGFNITRSAYSTSNPKLKGVELIEFPANSKDSISKRYVDPSWTKYGLMGSLTTDENGNTYTAPISAVNTFNMPLGQMNRVYRIDNQTGEMKLFKILPNADTSSGVVQYAVMGVYYDCHAHKLYVASVAGSTREKENGVIYEIDPQNGEILDQFKGYDAIGLFVGGQTGKKLLYFGSARNSGIYSVELSKSGKFLGKAKVELSLDQLGSRGDDKARRIRYDNLGRLTVFGAEFNFSLAAPSVRQESVLTFRYNSGDEKWEYVK